MDSEQTFPDSRERPGYFVGASENIGDALTFEAQDAVTNHKVAKSVVRPANNTGIPNHRVMFVNAISKERDKLIADGYHAPSEEKIEERLQDVLTPLSVSMPNAPKLKSDKTPSADLNNTQKDQRKGTLLPLMMGRKRVRRIQENFLHHKLTRFQQMLWFLGRKGDLEPPQTTRSGKAFSMSTNPRSLWQRLWGAHMASSSNPMG